MRRLLRYVGRPASLSRDSRAPRTGRYLDLTFAAGVRAFTVGRSRRVLGRQGGLLALRRGHVATRGTCRQAHSGLRAAMRVLEPLGTAGRHSERKFRCRPPVVLGPTVARRKLGPTGGVTAHSRACSSFIFDPADRRRRVARKRAVRRPKALRTPWSAEPFTRAPHETGLGPATGNRRKALPAAGLPERQTRLARARNRKKTPGPCLPGRPKRAARREASCSRVPGKPARGPSR